jgi:hypothetical protein
VLDSLRLQPLLWTIRVRQAEQLSVEEVHWYCDEQKSPFDASHGSGHLYKESAWNPKTSEAAQIPTEDNPSCAIQTFE